MQYNSVVLQTMSTLYHFCIQITKLSTCKTFFKPKSQKNVPANNCYLKVNSVQIIATMLYSLNYQLLNLTIGQKIYIIFYEGQTLQSNQSDYSICYKQDLLFSIYCFCPQNEEVDEKASAVLPSGLMDQLADPKWKERLEACDKFKQVQLIHSTLFIFNKNHIMCSYNNCLFCWVPYHV